jgi:hypothetical protein
LQAVPELLVPDLPDLPTHVAFQRVVCRRLVHVDLEQSSDYPGKRLPGM